MRILARYALGVGAAVALLAGCSGAPQRTIPLGGSANISSASNSAAMPEYFSVFYGFRGGENGYSPIGTLLNIDGVFYGATYFGGSPACYGKAYGCGTIFTMTLRGRHHVLYRFNPHGGFYPEGSLIHLGNSLYGVTVGGGTGHCGGGGCGTVFEISTSGKERTLYNFRGVNGRITDGEQPQGGLRYLGGRFYGVTFGGGRYQDGIIFTIDLSGKERILHHFSGGISNTDGDGPQAGLIDVNDTLYGTTSEGGKFNRACDQAFGNACGTVFSITPAGSYRVLYRFKGGRDAAAPLAGLTEFKGELFGTTFFGGNVASGCPAGCGTVFEVDPASGHEHVIYRFKGGADGNQPGAALLPYGGMFYGTTAFGGTGSCLFTDLGCGTAFAINPSGHETVLHEFNVNGRTSDRLVNVNGKLYGTTPVGGGYCEPIHGCGTFFRLTLQGSATTAEISK